MIVVVKMSVVVKITVVGNITDVGCRSVVSASTVFNTVTVNVGGARHGNSVGYSLCDTVGVNNTCGKWSWKYSEFLCYMTSSNSVDSFIDF